MYSDVPVRVTPRSSRNAISVEPDGSVRIWVTASPTDGQANEAVIALLASTLRIAKSRVTILRGDASRQKLLRVEGLSIEDCMRALKLHS